MRCTLATDSTATAEEHSCTRHALPNSPAPPPADHGRLDALTLTSIFAYNLAPAPARTGSAASGWMGGWDEGGSAAAGGQTHNAPAHAVCRRCRLHQPSHPTPHVRMPPAAAEHPAPALGVYMAWAGPDASRRASSCSGGGRVARDGAAARCKASHGLGRLKRCTRWLVGLGVWPLVPNSHRSGKLPRSEAPTPIACCFHVQRALQEVFDSPCQHLRLCKD